jgi:hypothetical protein
MTSDQLLGIALPARALSITVATPAPTAALYMKVGDENTGHSSHDRRLNHSAPAVTTCATSRTIARKSTVLFEMAYAR